MTFYGIKCHRAFACSLRNIFFVLLSLTLSTLATNVMAGGKPDSSVRNDRSDSDRGGSDDNSSGKNSRNSRGTKGANDDRGDRSDQQQSSGSSGQSSRHDSDDGGDTSGRYQEAAFLIACGYVRAPSGSPFKSGGEISANWEGNYDDGAPKNSKLNVRFSVNKRYDFSNPLCEQYILRQYQLRNGKGALVRRCETIKNDLFMASSDMNSGGGGGDDLSFGDLGSMFGDGSSDSANNDACEGEPANNVKFACAYLSFRDKVDDSAAQKRAAKIILAACRRAGANMQAELSFDQYNSYARSGVDAYGGYCGSRGGPVIIKQENKWYDTVGNVVLGLAKVGLPIWAMHDANKRHEANARLALDYNHQLGFPSIVTAGSGYGQGCAGCGGGGYYGGMGGVMYGGGAYSGMGGGCPFGACPGNGGYVVGGTGFPYAGGAYGGGSCGVPPYAPWYGGCGAVGGGGAGVPGGFYGPGGNYGSYPNMGGGFNGMGGPWSGNGFYGPGYGMNGAGGLPGPYGTAGGGNGWGNGAGNPYGYNGYAGQPGYWGGGQPFNANQAQMQAQMYAAYAAQMARQAQMQAQAAKAYQNTLNDMNKAEDKAYQAYSAYQMAQMGMSYPMMSGYSGGGGGGYSAGGYSYGGYVPGALSSGAYYPPYSSGSGSNLSISGGFNYSK